MLAAAASFTFVSCSDDDDTTTTPTPTPQPTKTELITAKNWKLTKQMVSINGSPESDFTQFYDACELDNLHKFATTGAFTIDEGATKCNASDPQINSTGTWMFTNNEAKLKITEGADVTEVEIMELSASKLVVKESVTDQGMTFVNTTTFSAQ